MTPASILLAVDRIEGGQIVLVPAGAADVPDVVVDERVLPEAREGDLVVVRLVPRKRL